MLNKNYLIYSSWRPDADVKWVIGDWQEFDIKNMQTIFYVDVQEIIQTKDELLHIVVVIYTLVKSVVKLHNNMLFLKFNVSVKMLLL